MKFPIKSDPVKSGCSIVCIEGSEIKISKHIIFSLKMDLISVNSADDEMLQYAAFHLGLHCLPMYPF